LEKTSEAEGRERRGDAKADLFFPSDGQFSRVVPLSRADDELVPSAQTGSEVAASADTSAPDEPDGHEEATLVPMRVSRNASLFQVSRPKKGVEQSWGFTAAVLALSVVAGVAAGAYMIRSQRPAETFRPDASNAEAAAVNGAGEKVVAAEPAEQPVPQASATAPQTAPQTEHDRLASATTTAAATAATTPQGVADTTPPGVTDTKVESVSTSASTPKASPRAADATARRAAETEPRAERPARAASEARDAAPAPRPTRSDAAPRHADRPATANAAPPERSLPISSPPPSARPKKVIQWP
jgi:hypothetical protein